MAVTNMRLVSVTGSIGRLDSVLEACTTGGDFQFEQAMSFFGGKSDFTPINDENPYSPLYNKLNSALTEARLTPDEDDGGEVNMTWEELQDYIDGFVTELTELSGARGTIEQEQTRLNQELEHLSHFKDMDIKLGDMYDCEYIKLRFGRLPKESYNKLRFYSDDPFIMMVPCSTDSRWVWGVYFAPIDRAAEVDRVFQSLMWERMHLPDARGTASEECAAIEERLGVLEKYVSDAQQSLEAYWKEHSGQCSTLLHRLQSRMDNFELRRYVARYKSGERFYLAGWVAADSAEELEKRIDALGVECDIDEPDAAEGHEPPVRLKNRWFSRPFEFFVDMYGLPVYNEVDPTPFVAFVYFLLFGMMFADVGQGFVLALVGWFFFWKKSGSKLGLVLTRCGVSSMFFGVLLGSVFGFENWLEGFWDWVHAKTGIPVSEGKLINIADSTITTPLIYATVGIGGVMIICAMLYNICTKIKQRMWGDALFGANGVAGLLFYGSVAAAVVGMFLFKANLISTPYIICFFVIPLLVIFLREPLGDLIEGKEKWLPEKPVDFIMQNFFELFEVLLSYVSNTVSFLRVGAFMLVHFYMMSVVFTLAEGCEPGSVPFIIVVAIGNIIVIALEGLLTGIQALRLVFYEMFSRFYTGSGKAFAPIETGRRLPQRQ